MEAVKFTLSGQSAFFKKPDVNEVCYFTYSHIHKVALLGMLGAIVGYRGYASQWKVVKKSEMLKADYPEFYEKLSQLKVSIVPKNDSGYIPKKIQIFNNSVGYANEDGNLIVREQWLERPVWDIYILLDCNEAENVAQYLQQRKCVYIPYLGKNEHLADIKDVKRVEVSKVNEQEVEITSLFLKSTGSPTELDDCNGEIVRYCEKLPVALNPNTNLYEYQDFCYTNVPIELECGNLYKDDNNVLEFF